MRIATWSHPGLSTLIVRTGRRNGRRLRFHPSGMRRQAASRPKLFPMGQWRAIEPTATLTVARAPDFGEPARACRSWQVMIAETVEKAA
jgi:hypothetical protein